MTDEGSDRNRWDAENYTLLRDAYGNVVKVYGLNLENQSYELFNSSPNASLPFLPNMSTQSVPSHANYHPHQRNFQQEFYAENRMHYGGDNSFNNGNNLQQPPKPPSGQTPNNMPSMYSSNPIINQLVGNWTPGTSIYGDCFMNNSNNANDNFQCANETHRQAFEQTHNIANSQGIPNESMENAMNAGVPPQFKKKQRIIAEVKPMRMSYSDVLSQNVLTEMETNPPNTTYNNNSTSNTAANQQGNGKKKVQTKSPIQFEKRSPITVISDEKFRKNQNSTMNGEKITKASNDLKPNNPMVKETKELKGTANVATSENKNIKKGSKKSEKNGKTKAKGIQNVSKSGNDKFVQDDDNYHLITDTSNQNNENENYENLYSVNYDRSSKSVSQASSYKKSKYSTSATSSGGRTATKQDKFYSKRNQKNHKSQRYQMLAKFWTMWLEYITKFVLWLWSLVSDVVYLSFGIMWDKLVIGYNHASVFMASMCSELGNRPNQLLKSVWSKVNSQLEKLSFWRKLFAKKQEEPVKDYYKDGKLPTTADEAMYSLLNCKGKDAYSILGVTPDCQQEQIRKHFHKIALLVHPDKNKQIGSEEAFKVLQRSFELIGEPESRKQYDLSLAEALNAEKAWSELNDLLKQLHTKISEAANTIRCSSCCSRHPRKPTGRPHYAARECNSCRIRHSAREGDIWAETAFFGLRWKYLALMEGKVFDITEWANCQKGALSHLQPNSHIVQYRIVLGQNSQQQQQAQQEKEKHNKKEQSSGESAFDDILSNIYSGQKQPSNTTRRKNKK